MPTTTSLKNALKSQYHASFAMLRDTIERCPDDLWLSTAPRNAYWQIAYHVLFFTHLYLMPDEAAFVPWKGHQSQVQHPNGIGGPPDPNSKLPLLANPYTKAEALDYLQICDRMVDEAVDQLDLDSPSCGFYWYKMSKLEHQFVNIRHLQHHTAQLADRLRAATDTGVRWVGGKLAAS